jgi:hypothetical protein
MEVGERPVIEKFDVASKTSIVVLHRLVPIAEDE